VSVAPLRIAVCRDTGGWDERFAEALESRIDQGADVVYAMVDIGAHDWIARLDPYDVVLWNPQFMGPFAASQFKEKVYFLERFRGKRVFPNYRSAWHFESKVAQSYLLDALDVPRPRTVVSFERADAAAAVAALERSTTYPEKLGSGMPFEPDTRLQDYFEALAFRAAGQADKARAALRAAADFTLKHPDNHGTGAYFGGLALERLGEGAKAASVLKTAARPPRDILDALAALNR
jgi:hypothetical protein